MTHLALAVDDDEHILFIYDRVLSKVNFEVLQATDGSEAIAILESNTPNLLFLDMLLPRVNGREVLAFIQDKPHLARMYIVVISAHPEFQLDAHLYDEFMLKPVRPGDIQNAAERAITQLMR
ncbi:MAG: response regulator [Chloroflexi bacterium]|nr:MAG: response regulator [Chloroflexota bacterium]